MTEGSKATSSGSAEALAERAGAAAMLEGRGVLVEVKRFDWGVVGTFHDPDGNTCELKEVSDPFFIRGRAERCISHDFRGALRARPPELFFGSEQRAGGSLGACDREPDVCSLTGS